MKKLLSLLLLSVSLVVCSKTEPPVDAQRRDSHPSIDHPQPRPTKVSFSTNTPPTAAPTATPTATATVTPTATFIQFVGTEDSTTIFRNHGVGLQSNLITETESYATATPVANYPIPNMLYRFNWIDVEATQGSRNFARLVTAAAKARADNQLLNWRMYLHDPGSGIGEPTWVRTGTGLSGWQASHSDGCASTCAYSDWDDADNITAYTSTVQAIATAMANYPGPQIIDNGWGEYNENNHSGSSYTGGSATGIAPTPIGGAGNELPTPLPTPKANFVQIYPTAFGSTALYVGFADDQLTFDAGAARGHGGRQDGWGYRNVVTNPTATPGACSAAGVQMCTLMRRTMMANYDTLVPAGAATPTPIAAPTISQPNLWQTQPILLETWSTLSSWNSSSWPFAASLKFATDNHVSQINTKNNFSPTYFENNFRDMLRLMGYRHTLSSVSNPGNVTANVAFNLNTVWENNGTSPSYLKHKILFKFCKQGGTGIYPDCYKVSSGTEALWLPNVVTPVTTSITLPTWVAAGTYDVYVGLGRDSGSWLIPEERLAITSPAYTDGWYLTTTTTVANSSPTTAPTLDYAGDFNGTNQSLSFTDNDSVSLNATDLTLCGRVNADAFGAIKGIVTKGDKGVAASLEYWLGYSLSANRYQIVISNGSTLYTTSANSYGAPATGTWAWVCGSFNNTSKALNIEVDNGTTDTSTATGSVPNTSQTLRIGADSAGRYWDGRIDKVRVWKRLLTSAEEAAIYNSGDPLKVEDMTEAQRKGLYIALENDDAAGATRVDAWQAWRYTDSNTVGQGSSS